MGDEQVYSSLDAILGGNSLKSEYFPEPTTKKRPGGRSLGGRSWKKKRYSDSEEDTDSDAEEIENSQEFASTSHSRSRSPSSETDPEWGPGQRTTRRGRKIQTYNVKKMFEDQMSKLPDRKKTRGRPKGSKNTAKFRAMQQMLNDPALKPTIPQEKKDLEYYTSILPQPTDPPLDADARHFVEKVYSEEAISISSLGFQKFVKSISDEMTLNLFNDVKNHYVFPQDSSDNLQIVQMMRHVWNTLPVGTRREWESEARQDYILKQKTDNFIKEEIDDEKMEVDENGEIKFGTKTEPKSVVMPLSEIAFFGQDTPNRETNLPTEIVADCCKGGGKWTCFQDVQSHMLSSHYAAMMFGCHLCGEMFQAKEQLLGHNCPDFRQYLSSRICIGHIEQPEVTRSHLFLVCCDCSLWLPIKSDYVGERFNRAWSFFCTIVKYHTCGFFLPYVVNFFEEPPVRTNGFEIRLSIKFFPYRLYNKKIELSCSECSVDFTSIQEAEEHNAVNHPQKFPPCRRCGVLVHSAAAYCQHLLSHMGDAILFGMYLRSGCRLYPPTHAKNAVPKIGFSSNIAAIGGCPLPTTTKFNRKHVDYVEHSEPMLREKILNGMIHEETDDEESDDEGTHPDQSRPDVGFELADYRDFNQTENEVDMVKKLNEFFGKQCDGSGLLDNRTKLSARLEEFVKTLDSSEGPEIGELAPFNIVDEIVEKYSHSVSLPLHACLEQFSESLLERNYYFCSECNKILAQEDHQCENPKVVSIFTAQLPSNTLISCPVCKIHVCSIFSLRVHFICEHSNDVEFTAFRPAGEPKRSLQEIARQMLAKTDKRTAFAHKIDKELRMELNGRLKSTIVKRPEPPTPYRYNQGLGQSRNIIGSSMSASYVPPSLRVPASSNQIAPFRATIYMGQTTFVCNFSSCSFYVTSQRLMTDHLRTHHAAVCSGCAQAFSSVAKVQDHRASCSKVFSKHSINDLFAFCSICQERGSVLVMYSHAFENHLRSITYGKLTGKIYTHSQGQPIIHSIGPAGSQRSAIASANRYQNMYPSQLTPSRTSTRDGSTLCIYQKPRNPDGMCYLCGFESSSQSVIREHLERHTEKWNKCPFCPLDDFYFNSHDDMLAHLLKEHYISESRTLACKFCFKKVEKNFVAHIIYDCAFSRNCALCTYSTTNTELLMAHWEKHHSREFHRFKCSECALMFANLIQFETHTCKAANLPHKCNCGDTTVFPTRIEFFTHFDSHINHMLNGCRLCDLTFPTKQALTLHRTTHCKNMGQPNVRQVICLDTDLIPPQHLSGRGQITVRDVLRDSIVRPDSHSSAESSEAEVPEIEAAPSPLTPEEQMAVDVKETMTSMVKRTCLDMGEDWLESVDDDDDLMIIESAADHLTANVRSEAKDDSIGGSGQPGYVEDDDEDDNIMNPSSPSHDKVIVKEVHDEDGDEDINVVAEVQHQPGTTSSAVSTTRQKQFMCSKCSLGFITQGSLNNHLTTAHANDAGGICEKVYGMPMSGTYWICRNCCVAFESEARHKQHMAGHGMNSAISCYECSTISYNSVLYEQHMKSHHVEKIYYACGHCMLMFKTEARLYHHLMTHHNVSMLFFCKFCSYTGFSMQSLVFHITHSACLDMMMKRKQTSIKCVGMCPTGIVHFQPDNPARYEELLKQGRPVATPSECVHRTFLAPTETVVACKDCNCVMALASFSAIMSSMLGGAAVDIHMNLDHDTLNPFRQDMSSRRAVNTARAVNFNRGTSAPQPIQIGNNRIINGARPSPTTLAQIQPGRFPVSQPRPGTQATATVRTTVRPLQWPPAGHSSTRNGSGAIDDDVVPVENGSSTPQRVVVPSSLRYQRNQPTPRPPTRPIVPVSNMNRCDTCGFHLKTDSVARLHQLHKNGMDWFCLDCAVSQKSDMDAIRHFYDTHVSQAEARHKKSRATANDEFRPIRYELSCPIQNCSEAPFKSLILFKQHLAQKHKQELCFTSECCQVSFATESAKVQHEAAHLKFEEINGVPAQCCQLCGITNQWNCMDSSGRYNITHMATHGLQFYGMCRHCYTCFPSDDNGNRVVAHFEKDHCQKMTGGKTFCNICKTMMPNAMVAQHVRELHFVHGYKPYDQVPGTLIVRAGQQTNAFLGLPPPPGSTNA